MFTPALSRALGKQARSSKLLRLLAGPHGLDGYTELLKPTWTGAAARAEIVGVARTTPRSVTLTMVPNDAFGGFRAGQHLGIGVEIDGRRRTRRYSPASTADAPQIELTVAMHDSGLVSRHLFHHARRGMIVDIDSAAGDFVLPEVTPSRILFISGGSGITPVLSMLRTLVAVHSSAQIGFIHFARSPALVSYRDDLTVLGRNSTVHVALRYPRLNESGSLRGYFTPDHVAAVLPDPEAVYVCGPSALVSAVKSHYPDASSETFALTPHVRTDHPPGTVTFSDSGVTVSGDGRPLLAQAEDAGLSPTSGCRMGVCRTCTRRKPQGAVYHLLSGEVSADDEDIQLCVTVPVGDVVVAL